MKALGIDIGGTSLKVVYFDDSKIRSFFLKTPRDKKSFEALVKKLILENGGKTLHKIGFGIPGQVDSARATARNVAKLKYLNGFDFGKFVRNMNLGVIVRADNDVNCHMNAEIKFGSARKFRNAVMIAIGSGIGGSIVIEGQIRRGSGSAGEIGHMILERGKDFEQLAAGRTLRKFNKKEISRVCYYTGIACANVVNILNPEAIVLTGGVVLSNPVISGARKIMKKYIVDPKARNTPVLKAEMGEFGAAVGAAWL